MVQKHWAGIERRASQHQRKNIINKHDKSKKKEEVMLMEKVGGEWVEGRSRGKMGIE